MKNYSLIILLTVFFICGCGLGKIDHQEAQTLAENLLNDLQHENYNSLGKYYTSSFNESEPDEKKIKKYKRLKEVMGPVQSYKLASSKESRDEDKGINQLELVYHVKCARITVKETFFIINDEGELKIIFQNIENLLH